MNGELQLLKHENQGMKNKVHWLRNCRFKCNSMDLALFWIIGITNYTLHYVLRKDTITPQ